MSTKLVFAVFGFLGVVTVLCSAFVSSDRKFVNENLYGIRSHTQNHTNVPVVIPRMAKAYSTHREGEGSEIPVPAAGMSMDHTGHAMMTSGGDKTKSGKKKKGDLLSKILPFMVMPFLISSSLIPMVLTSLKLMLLKSLFVGKIAIFLLAVNFLWKSGNKGGVYSHNINIEHDQKDLHEEHYGYNGDEEYGNYVNRRSNRYR